jgi:hypothetical protein
MGVGVWNFISQPWMQQRRRPEVCPHPFYPHDTILLLELHCKSFPIFVTLGLELWQGPDFSWNKTSFLNRLFECCGLVDLIIGKDLKLPHVNEQVCLRQKTF